MYDMYALQRMIQAIVRVWFVRLYGKIIHERYEIFVVKYLNIYVCAITDVVFNNS